MENKTNEEEYPILLIPEEDIKVMSVINQEHLIAQMKTLIVLQCKMLANGDNDKAIKLTKQSMDGIKNVLRQKRQRLIKKYQKK